MRTEWQKRFSLALRSRGIVRHMEMPFHGRFCWPAQDRVRAHPPLRAPRKPPVFTASVFLERKGRIGKAVPVYLSVASRPSSRSMPAGCDRPRAKIDEKCWFDAGLSGETPLFPGTMCHGWKDTVEPAAIQVAPDPRESGVAHIHLDWRVMGDQDEHGEEPVTAL